MAALLCLHSTFPKMTVKPLAVLNRPQRLCVPFELKQGQTRLFHQLPSGLNMEVIEQKSAKNKDLDGKIRGRSEKPPLVFVHGSYHAAWCWAEHWLPFFSGSGFDCYAVSLLGQGESDAPSGTVAGSLKTHAGDIADFIRENLSSHPVLLGHSFGGLIIQYYIAKIRNEQSPGNLLLLEPYLYALYLLRVTRSLAAKAFQTDLSLCKETFFSSTMKDPLVLRFVHDLSLLVHKSAILHVATHIYCYQELMKESSRMPLFDLRKLNASLPVPSVPKSSLEVLVVGAKDDFIVDAEGLNETGRFYGVSPVCVEGVAHDMMLDSSWEKGAAVILSWLDNLSSYH
ncbi:hypothetical protein JRO89_XS11G0006000 [Xanthoceras sorbifolium]|uniref:AB hydrolase-1 domain-containing protein n=1 Tax=Xanthoceras sorbifolium TaxID=99658 RepID=A0ABQ8HE97_9ROSI|nr:hypothetical protein JRO89_XS11G0006000 [Xanthoceras sorbifolium]